MSKFFTSALRFSKHIQVQQHLNKVASGRLNMAATMATKPTVVVPLVRRAFSSEASSNVIDFDTIQSIIKNNTNKDYDLIDVREKGELVQGYIPTAKNVPLSRFQQAWQLSDDDFEAEFGFAKPQADNKVIVYCQAGIRSAKAADYLAQLGYQNIQNYKGSYADYAEKTKAS